MPYSGTGSYIREHNWQADKAALIPVTASRMDTEHDAFATGLSTAICRDGQSTTTSRIPFGAGISIYDGTGDSVLGLNFTSDTDCGIWRSGANAWKLVAGAQPAIVLSATSVTVPLVLLATSTFQVTGPASCLSTLTVASNFSINGTVFTVAAASGNTAIAGTLSVAGATFTHTVTTASQAGCSWTTTHDKSVAGADGDVLLQLDCAGKDTASNAQTYTRFEVLAEDATSGGEEGMFRWRVARAGSITSVMVLSGEGDGTHASLKPAADDVLCLGTPTSRISDLYLATGGTINFSNSDMVLTHSTDTLTVTGGTFAVTGPLAATGTLHVNTATATPVGGSIAMRMIMGSDGVGIYAGSGSPSLVAARGSLYLRTDATTTTTRLYVNLTGSNTWTTFTSAA